MEAADFLYIWVQNKNHLSSKGVPSARSRLPSARDMDITKVISVKNHIDT